MKTLQMMLLLIATVCLASQIEAEKVLSYETNKFIPLEKLLDALGKSVYDSDSYSDPLRNGLGFRVLMLLEASEDKETPNTLLSQFSVSDLVAVNNWDLDSCNEAKLKERRNFCEQFSAEEEANTDCPLEKTRGNCIRWNLGLYCWSIVDRVQEGCPLKQLRARIGDGEDALEDFRVKLNAKLSKKTVLRNNKYLPVELLDGWQYKKAVRSLLGKKEPSDVEEFKRVCSMLVEGATRHGVKFDRYGVWPNYLRICQTIISNK